MKIYKSTRARKVFDDKGYNYISCKKINNGNFNYLCEKDGIIHSFELSFTDTAIICFSHKIGFVDFVATETLNTNPEIING